MATKERKAAAARRRFKVMIVEDSKLQARHLESALVSRGFDVTVSVNGQAALTMLRSETPDLVITDVIMPEMDGFKLCEAIRADPQLESLPVIVVTVLSSTRDVVRALECGADAFLPKPYTDESLFARTDHILANRDRPRHSPTHETVTFSLEGEEVIVGLFPQRIVDLLLSAYGAAVDKGRELAGTAKELRSSKTTLEELNENLERTVGERMERIAQMLDQERLVGKILTILNRRDEWESLITDILELIHTATGLEAIAVRLERDGDSPYIVSRGFPSEFILTEKSLVPCDWANLPKCDASGRDEIACMCGNMLCGLTDPVLSFFTEHGSFWTNSTTQLLASTTEKKRQSATRSQCNTFGYESVALIPIRSNDQMIGLLQLNDHRTDQFDAKTIQFFEELAVSIGAAFNRQQAEEALIDREEKLRHIIDNSTNLFYAHTPNHKLTFLSPQTRQLLDCTPEEAMVVWTELTTDNPINAKGLEITNEAIRTGNRQPAYELELIGKKGRKVWVEVNETPVVVNEKTVSMVGSLTDITKRKHSEEDKLAMESQLRQSQKLESLGTMASGIAHEINNPLMGMINYADLIGEKVEDEMIKEYSQAIMKEGNRIAKIVRNLLSFSRQDREPHALAGVADIIEASVSLVGSLLRKDQIAMEIDIPEYLPQLKCRSQQIQQVMINLLANAHDALDLRYPEYDVNKLIRITAHSFEKDGEDWIRTTVEDHGVGIPEDIACRIFDPFFTTKPRPGGTGLGLSVSFGIVQEHHGELTVESVPGEFTRFHMDLRVNNGWSHKERQEENAQVGVSR